ncbi:MAG: hypothetical protein M0P01_05100 [Treponema sp.]|nr:hypothetical protein [Treponema sp.]
MFTGFHIRFICLSTFLFCSLCVSCANTTPEILSSSATVIFDYNDDSSVPLIRLSVFTETGSDVRRAAQIRISSKTEEYSWTVDNPQLLGSDNRQWAGYTNFAVPDAAVIPQGGYDLFYTDAEEHTVQTSFTVTYPEKLIESKSSDVKYVLGTYAKEMIAVYMSDGTLIYYNERKSKWTDDDAIWNEFKLASTMRICWTSPDNSVICLMPVKKRPSSDSML